MNRFCYRVIFNKNLGRLVVVSEITKAQGKSGNLGGGLGKKPTWLPISLMTKLAPLTIACWLGCSGSAFANVISDSQAPVFQRPIIAAAKNDRQQTVALVQIQTPVQGISHNKYTQFDVPNQGIVLNNARTGASTQLVGAVAANPFLKQGEAHTIVNEVRSSKASQLAGSIEVAGQKANLVIANPSGITVTGAGFINVHEATLSTGQAINKQGHIHHTVNKGAIVIQTPKSANVATQTTTNNIGLGGPNKNADLVNLYSKTANINAQVQAEYAITTVTGTNQISDVGQVTPITSNQTTTNTTKPTTAIDIKSLGGMTAGSISLVGTDKGFGVNQAGSLNAKQAITITADGKITHSGQSSVQQGVVSLKSNTAVGLHGSISNKTTIWASKDIAMSAPTIMANHASLNSTSNITLQAKQELGTNNTTIHAGKKIEAIIFDNPTPKNTNGTASFTNTTFTTQGALTTANLQGNLTHNQSIIDAAGNVSSFAKGQQTLDHTNITSQANIQIQANSDLIVNNSQINSAKHTTIYVQGNQTTTNSTLIAKGIVSDVVKGDHRINGNGTYQGGAVLLDSTSLTLNGRLIARTTKSPLLNSNKNAQVLNGSLSIQTDRALTLNSTNHNLAIGGDISLVSQQGKLTLQNTNPVTNGNQAHYTLNAHQGNLTLQGSEVQLQGVNLKSKNNLTVYATQGSVVMDGVKREFSNKNQSGSDQKRALEAKLDEAARLSLTTRADAFTNTKSRIENQLGILNSNSTGFIHTPTTLVSQAGDIGVYAKQGILSQGALLNAVSGNITLEAQGVLPFAYQQTTKSSQSGSSNQSDAETQTDKAASIILTGSQNRYEIGQDGNDHHRLLSFGSPSMLTAGRDIDIRATKAATDKQDETPTLVLQGTKAKANGAIDIRANHHLLLDVGIDFEYSYDKTTRKHGRWYRRKYTTTETTNEWVDADVVELTAGNLRLQTTGNDSNNGQKHHLDIYGAELNTTGNITLGASGNINLYATKDTHTTQQNNQTKKKFLGIKTGTSNSKYNFSQIAAVPASLSAQFISSRSKGDTLLEGTRFEYLKGAQISAGGKIRLLAALSELQTATQREDNWVVWQRTQGEGQHTQTAQLPSFTGTAAPMFEAQGGLNIQIPISEKDVQKRQLKDEIITLASQPQYSYLNDLVNRNDVDWQQIILTDKDWDYKQQGLTPAGAAIVAIAVAYATGGVGTALTSTVATATGSTTLGTMTSAAFSSLVTQASISLIDNQGNIKQTLKDLGSKQNIKQMTFAIASAGIGSKINQTLSKSLGVGDIANSHNFSHKISKGIANATSTALLESTIYGTSLEKSLIKNLRGEVANAVASEVFTDYVKPLDKDTLIDNITHKLAAGLTGCLSAKAAGNRCEAGSIGAVVGEMWGDYQVDDPNTLTQAQKDKLINQAKLIAGITAVFAGEDVNVAAGVAAEAVENNTFAEIYPNEWVEIVNNTDGSYGLELHEAISRNKQYILIGTSFIPVVGDIQGFVEAKTAGDHVFATIGLIPGLGDVAQKAHKAKKAYDTAKSANDVKGMKSAIQEGVDVLKAEGRAEVVSGRSVASRINIANGRTAYTPLRSNGHPVSAGFDHVLEGHFNSPLANNRSVFSITPDKLKRILSDKHTISSPVRQLDGGQFERVVNTGRIVGKASLNQGGGDTTYIKILTDVKGNLITVYPIKGGTQ
ncbi:filamentous hemagglutinin family N-terminal domain protein [Moraxella catarrhalis]|uniref:Filamentous hemagglutinin family N-terminal domain protein n=9 Tax=Moraxella catarrhalis TaxID=480 RepID=A0A3Q9GGR8_MORCA|nr:DUF637 domain-containing protein [Moraxella catarrhalis]AZQ93757.1 filamentous hemagglutinin family N-terminal domain protein [Moraxella catarrhalis]